MFSSYPSTRVSTKSFSLVQNAFLQADGLPFGDVLSEEEIHEAFAAEMRRPRTGGFLAGHFYAATAGAFSASYASGER